MREMQEDPEREQRINYEAIVDTYNREECAMGWYYYVQEKLTCPFRAKCISERKTSILQKSEIVTVQCMASEDECANELMVEICWQERKLTVPLSQLEAIDADEETQESIEDWHYGIARGYGY